MAAALAPSTRRLLNLVIADPSAADRVRARTLRRSPVGTPDQAPGRAGDSADRAPRVDRATASAFLTDLDGHSHDHRDYLLTGPKALGYRDAAAIITAHTGRPIRVEPVGVDAWPPAVGPSKSRHRESRRSLRSTAESRVLSPVPGVSRARAGPWVGISAE
jgi:uncharacterized protein YbjT (DUF2867 family)